MDRNTEQREPGCSTESEQSDGTALERASGPGTSDLCMTKAMVSTRVRAKTAISVINVQATAHPNGPLFHAILQNQIQAVTSFIVNYKTSKRLRWRPSSEEHQINQKDTESTSLRKGQNQHYGELKPLLIKRHHLEEKECIGGNV